MQDFPFVIPPLIIIAPFSFNSQLTVSFLVIPFSFPFSLFILSVWNFPKWHQPIYLLIVFTSNANDVEMNAQTFRYFSLLSKQNKNVFFRLRSFYNKTKTFFRLRCYCIKTKTFYFVSDVSASKQKHFVLSQIFFEQNKNLMILPDMEQKHYFISDLFISNKNVLFRLMCFSVKKKFCFTWDVSTWNQKFLFSLFLYLTKTFLFGPQITVKYFHLV
jgi:hypothetical protein